MSGCTGYFNADRSSMGRFLPERYARVLEIGCAAGSFAKTLRQQPCELWGVEPNPEAARQAATMFDHLLQGTYEDTRDRLPDRYFDLVVCNDVIEHMPDHDAFLRHIRTKMTPGAFLVGSVPNVRHITCLYKLLVLRDWPYSNSGILDRTHLRFFTRKSLHRALTQIAVALHQLLEAFRH